MAQIKSVYNDIGIATDGVVGIINDYFNGGTYGKFLDKDIPGGYKKWKADMDQYSKDYSLDGPMSTGFNEMNTMGILKNRPELYVRLALAKMKKARMSGSFEQLSDEEFNSLIDEFTRDPSNFEPAKRRAISIKYDKNIEEQRQLEKWMKRDWQRKAGIIK